MTRRLRLLAPAKVNWTLEVLHRRPDGFHELRSVLQTIDLCDVITVTESDQIDLHLTGAAGPLADEPPARNLAWRAAEALRRHRRVRAGVRIELEKHVPIAAGLGGGSSDAAAVLRACNVLWGLDEPELNLVEMAGELGSDPPFFVAGGTVTVRGRGEDVRQLPDAQAPTFMLAMPPEEHRGEKTAEMFGALTPDDFSDGEATRGLEDVITRGRTIDDAELCNVFERVVPTQQPGAARAMDALREAGWSPRLAGAGPSFFVLLGPGVDADALSQRIKQLGFVPRMSRALPRRDALAIEVL